MPRIAARLDDLKAADPDVAARAEPLLTQLKGLERPDYRRRGRRPRLPPRGIKSSTAASIPAKRCCLQYARDEKAQLAALVDAAAELQATFGDWRVAWGDVHRLSPSAAIVGCLGAAAD